MNKKFDSVKFQRKKRTALSKKLTDKTPAELMRFFNLKTGSKTSTIGKAAWTLSVKQTGPSRVYFAQVN
jgi:hypothetical protein